MSDKKKYVITSITLGLIAASSAALIAVTNLVTKDKIRESEQQRIVKGIQSIFTECESFKENELVNSYKYVMTAYRVVDKNDAELGYAFQTIGSNQYGKISLIVGYENAISTASFKGVYVVVDEQTYASTLEDNYISQLPDILEDVNCGATYGAKLVREMIKEAGKAAEDIWN